MAWQASSTFRPIYNWWLATVIHHAWPWSIFAKTHRLASRWNYFKIWAYAWLSATKDASEVVQIGVKPYIRPSKVDAKLHGAEPIELFGANLPNFGSILINAESRD
jgi:hypothetical protein